MVITPKEVAALCEGLRRNIKVDLREFKDLFERDLRNELSEIKVSQSFSNKRYEEMMNILMAALSEAKQVRTENAKLESKLEEPSKLTKTSEIRILQILQCPRNSNIETEEFPSTPNEYITDMIEKRDWAAVVQIAADDIQVCHRVPVANINVKKKAIVQFVNRKKRNGFLEKLWKMRLWSKELGFEKPSPLYVNEHVCPGVKRLLCQATSRKREGK